jgi:hypothetical protein
MAQQARLAQAALIRYSAPLPLLAVAVVGAARPIKMLWRAALAAVQAETSQTLQEPQAIRLALAQAKATMAVIASQNLLKALAAAVVEHLPLERKALCLLLLAAMVALVQHRPFLVRPLLMLAAAERVD